MKTRITGMLKILKIGLWLLGLFLLASGLWGVFAPRLGKEIQYSPLEGFIMGVAGSAILYGLMLSRHINWRR